MNLNNIKAIVLQTRKYKENDMLLVCIAEGLGKIYLIAPRASLTNSHLRAVCQTLTLARMSIRLVKNQEDLYYLQQALILDAYADIKHNDFKLASACYISGLTTELMLGGQNLPSCFDLLLSYLTVLTVIENEDQITFFHCALILRLIATVGLQYIPKWCSQCGNDLSGDWQQCLTSGCIFCHKCFLKNGRIISVELQQQWQRLYDCDLTTNEWWIISPELVKAIELYVISLIGKKPAGVAYLKAIRGY